MYFFILLIFNNSLLKYENYSKWLEIKEKEKAFLEGYWAAIVLSRDYWEGVTGSARRARQEQAARHSQAQHSSTLDNVRSLFERRTSLRSDTVGSGDDDTRKKARKIPSNRECWRKVLPSISSFLIDCLTL